MAVVIKMYTFSKKENSTIRPLDSQGVEFNCVIKETNNILSPSISLNIPFATPPVDYNYAYIAAYKRYYFIASWTFENALWTAELNVDTLATWKPQIGALQCYILRSSSSSRGEILDTAYPATGNTVLDLDEKTSPWAVSTLEQGVYVVGIAGQKTTYYIFTLDSLETFLSFLFSDDYAEALLSGWATAYPELKVQMNPLQYITSIMWMPFVSTEYGVLSIRVGWVDVEVPLGRVFRVDGSGIREGESTWTLKRHNQSSRGSYLNNAPFSNYTLYYPPWGIINIDPELVANSATLTAKWSVDLRTGQGTLVISADNYKTSWLHSQVGVPYQVSQVLNRGFGVGSVMSAALGSGVGLLTGAATGNVGAIAGAISNAVSSIGNYGASKIPSATTIGSNGGIDSLLGEPSLQYEWKQIVTEDNVRKGRPLCEVRQISTLAGFVLVDNANVNFAALESEKESIKVFMEGGFYYE